MLTVCQIPWETGLRLLKGDKKQIRSLYIGCVTNITTLEFLSFTRKPWLFFILYMYIWGRCAYRTTELSAGKSWQWGLEPSVQHTAPKEEQSRKNYRRLTQNMGSFIVSFLIYWAESSEISHSNINQSKCKLSVTPNSHQLILLYWQQMLNRWVSYIHIPEFTFAERVLWCMWENSACQFKEMYMISLSRPYKNIWEQDNVCPDLPKSWGDHLKSALHSWVLMLTLGLLHQQMCENACTLRTPSRLHIWRSASATAIPAKSWNDISKLSIPSLRPVSGQKNSTKEFVIWLRTKRSPSECDTDFQEASPAPRPVLPF